MSVLTRIKNNQITDTTITGSKLVTKTITSGLLEDNLTYGSNLTVSGNLTVNGTTTIVDTTNTLIADPLLVLSRGETGTPSVDSGLIIERGTSSNVGIIWDESADVFAIINTTEDGTTAGNITISSYANFKAADLESATASLGNIDIGSNAITSTDTNGDINLTPNGSGEVVASTLSVSDLTSGRVVLAGASGALNDSANLTFDGSTLAVTGAATVSTTLEVTGTTTLSSALDVTGLASLDGGIDVDGAFTVANTSGNIATSGTLSVTGEATLASATVSDLTSGRVVLAGTAGAIEDSGNLTFDGSTLTVTGDVSASGDIGGATATVSGNATVGGTLGVTGESTLASATVSDLTNGRVVLAGTSGAIEDSSNLTFDGTTLTTTKVTVDNISIDSDTISSVHSEIIIDPSTAGTGGTVIIQGNLQVTGTTTQVDSTVVTIADPLFQLGADSNDNLDRGITALYNDGTAKTAFFGLDDSAGEFVFIYDATDSSSVISGSLGNAAFGSLRVTDLTDNRILIAGASGEVEDSANLTFNGSTLAVTGAATISTTLGVTGNTTVGGTLGVTGESTLASATVSDLTSGRVVLAGTSGAIEDSGNLTFNGTTLTTTAAAIDNVSIDGNTVTTSAGGLTINSFTGETTIDDNATVTGTLDVTGATALSSTLGVTGEATLASATVSDLTSGRVVLAGTAGAIEDSANLTFSSNTLTVSGSAVVDNVTIDGNSITSSDNLTFDAAASGAIVVNEAGADVDIRMEASSQANALFIEGSTGNIGIRTATPTAGAAITINTTDSFIVPNGTTAQRPGTPTTAMLRYNSSLAQLEFYNGTEWKVAGAEFTIITADDFSGDGSTVAFTLSEDATSAGLLVALNGVLQDPGTAYSVSGTTLTFTEAPASGDNIDARIITTTTEVVNIGDGDTSIAVDDTAETATTTINGNVVITVTNAAVVPGANVTYDLGSSSLQWNTIYGKATSAQYADLAENYTADAHYESGTVVSFGGDAEVTVTGVDADRKVAGVVSTDPAHLMNSGLEADHVVALALQGRVPCKVVGAVEKGDTMVAAGNGFARAEADPKVGTVIGKALEAHAGGKGVIEVAVGRF